MALKQHKDDQVRYDQQVDNSRNYVVPFIEKTKSITAGTRVLEIGCGEGGVLTPFAEKGAICVGVDLNPIRIELANRFLAPQVAAGAMTFLFKNVYDADFLERYRHSFDLILLKDTIEHIPDQERFISYLKQLMAEGGQIFFGFPPWQMPFGGHQQICQGPLTSKVPYYHLLPAFLYKRILKMAGEPEGVIQDLMEVKETQISIERFERILKASSLKILQKQHYLINPIYQFKFGLKPRKQSPLISAIPYVRDFLTTCVYYTVGLA